VVKTAAIFDNPKPAAPDAFGGLDEVAGAELAPDPPLVVVLLPPLPPLLDGAADDIGALMLLALIDDATDEAADDADDTIDLTLLAALDTAEEAELIAELAELTAELAEEELDWRRDAKDGRVTPKAAHN